ncbi:hypothetical protein CEUSTIGMA_g5822.t1 [Chlamydomonas eustigma]|uniref:MACPF domain-containing protein n=1 Tax=Chlamydomonas eustigma TaxID=1157962 RepID=A0A250X6I7_9CHLO|nr:hypothetical protein CEUSTIGMA_g5822.t1 [Chlamydomonas eustigma]|eukprot:GAX78380.1 hypothetical protein CEUSTIGMA_g5822.t1 [Chlamydomonas eustigma]
MQLGISPIHTSAAAAVATTTTVAAGGEKFDAQSFSHSGSIMADDGPSSAGRKILNASDIPSTSYNLFTDRLGAIVDIFREDLLDSSLGSKNLKVFDEASMATIAADCFVHDYLGKASAETYQFSTKSEFADSIASSVDVSASGWGASFPASTTFKKSSERSTSNTGASLNWYQKNYQGQIKDKCTRGKSKSAVIDPVLYNLFHQLPTSCNSAETCKPFLTLRKDYGTHILSGMNTGAHLSFVVTATSSSSLTSSEVLVSVCAGYTAPAATASVSACASYASGSSSKQSSSEVETSAFTVGGNPTDSSAQAIIGGLPSLPSGATVQQFLFGSLTSAVASGYQFLPLWEVLSSSFSATPDDALRSQTFQRLFEIGYLATGLWPTVRHAPAPGFGGVVGTPYSFQRYGTD